MTRKILGLLGFVAALAAASGAAMADVNSSTSAANEPGNVCEARDEVPAPVSVMNPAVLEQLLAQALPSSPPVCVSSGSADPRCRAESSGDAPTRSVFDPLRRQSQLAPDPLALADPSATAQRFSPDVSPALADGYSRDLDRPPQR